MECSFQSESNFFIEYHFALSNSVCSSKSKSGASIET